MQRIFQSTLSQINFWLRRPRCLSQLAHNHTQNTLEEEDDFLVPKIPHFDYIPSPYTGLLASEILEKRKEYFSPSILHLYKKPLNYLVDGKMQYLYDEKGRSYLDAFGGIATICCGHCHPDGVEAIVNQTRCLQHSTVLYVHHAIVDFAEALVAKLLGDLKPLQILEFG